MWPIWHFKKRRNAVSLEYYQNRSEGTNHWQAIRRNIFTGQMRNRMKFEFESLKGQSQIYLYKVHWRRSGIVRLQLSNKATVGI